MHKYYEEAAHTHPYHHAAGAVETARGSASTANRSFSVLAAQCRQRVGGKSRITNVLAPLAKPYWSTLDQEAGRPHSLYSGVPRLPCSYE